ncbi:MAG: glutamine synthetase III [Firmicutes bacterium]|nr:glutamine synthetase III [Bacillota bacterium]
MSGMTEEFGSMVFSDAVMQQRLPAEIYSALRSARQYGKRLTLAEADVVAEAMRDWAIERGATHYTHWFQPMTGITAEKHDSFLSPAKDGGALPEFSGRELIHSEPDASSFPSGGLRATFEARGYTAWDPTSYAFVKDGVLCIPTVFASYGGEAIDKKTPLLRSMDALNIQALRILKLFGDTQTAAVRANAGAEQEYFLIDRGVYEQRPDLIYTGRTLLGARPPKGQELDDHYFGAIKPRVAAFMRELDEELWRLGVPAKTEHNEVAPAQHELACVYSTVNIAADHNQLVMECMKRVADRHGMVCLLHEKPFAGVNGSGKHNNWSLSTDRGENLLNPGDTPEENAQFLLILTAVLQAVDEYQDLLRISVAGASNDHRLGGSEAPPAILSVFLGDEITGILDSIENGTPYESGEKVQFKVGVHVLPRFPKDTSDRNRTSPFAFTGNKFEFRMVGSSQSISEANIILNTAVADVLRRYADELEGTADFESALHELIKRSIREHRRIIFNGNGYEEAWVREAARRGLCNYRSTPDCVPHLLDAKNAELFRRNRVFSETELRARCEIVLDHYAKEVRIEALTLLDMLRKDVLPAVSRFTGALSATAHEKKKLCGESACRYEKTAAAELSARAAKLWDGAEKLEKAVRRIDDGRLSTESAVEICRGEILPEMETLREISDGAELIMDRAAWPYPSYGEILTSVY